MFSTTDGRVMYVTPLTSARINALHLGKGECFWICKRKNGRLTEFSVSGQPMEAAGPAKAPAAPRPPAPFKSNLPERVYYKPELSPAAEATLEEQLRASIDMAQRRKGNVGELGDGTLAIMAPLAPPAQGVRLSRAAQPAPVEQRALRRPWRSSARAWSWRRRRWSTSTRRCCTLLPNVTATV